MLEAARRRNELAEAKRQGRETSTSRVIERLDILTRNRLVDSKSDKKEARPSECQHPRLVGRGSAKVLWWTCPTCGARWPRYPEEATQTFA